MKAIYNPVQLVRFLILMTKRRWFEKEDGLMQFLNYMCIINSLPIMNQIYEGKGKTCIVKAYQAMQEKGAMQADFWEAVDFLQDRHMITVRGKWLCEDPRFSIHLSIRHHAGLFKVFRRVFGGEM